MARAYQQVGMMSYAVQHYQRVLTLPPERYNPARPVRDTRYSSCITFIDTPNA